MLTSMHAITSFVPITLILRATSAATLQGELKLAPTARCAVLPLTVCLIHATLFIVDVLSFGSSLL